MLELVSAEYTLLISRLILSIKVSINLGDLISSKNIAKTSAPTRPIISVGQYFCKIDATSCKRESPYK